MTPVFLQRPSMRKPNLLTFLKPFLSFLLIIISLTQGASTADDASCLKTLKAKIWDPNGYLSSWTFTDSTPGFICQFFGIECWNNNENRVLNLRLTNMGLKGHFPSGLQLCGSLTGLDLSRNSFTGSIPGNISDMVPFVASFDLSYNSFTGEIPVTLSLCPYLNTINLQDNSLTGQIPGQLATLSRLTAFNVANNLLSGPIPEQLAALPSLSTSSVANNSLSGPIPAFAGTQFPANNSGHAKRVWLLMCCLCFLLL